MRFGLWHAAASAVMLLCLALRYFQASPLPADPFGLVFVGLAAPSHFLLLALVASLPVVAGAWLAPGRWLLAASLVLQTSLLLAVALDSQVYTLYRSHIDGMIVGLLGSGSAWEILQPTAGDLLDLAKLLALATVVQLALAWGAYRLAARSGASPLWLLAVIAPFLVVQGMHAWADARALSSTTRAARVLPWMPALTAQRWLAARGWARAGDVPVAGVPAGESSLSYPLAAPDCRAAPADVRILVIVIEEWRFDQLDPITTPNIARFASESLVFERHFSAGATSRYGVFGLFYGLHGDYWDAMFAEERGPALIDALVALQPRFFVAATAPLVRPEFDRTVFAALRGRVGFVQPEGPPAAGDRAITTAFADFIAEAPQDPFFAVLYYDSPHSMDLPPGWTGPHQPARRWGSRLALGADTDPAPLRRGHDNSVNYVDSLVGEALDSLRRNGLLERTTVVITGDHGEEFNDLGQGYWGHNGNFARFQTQVGMLMHVPGRPAARVSSLTSHVDVAPTLMRHVLDCQAPPDSYSNGRSLLDGAPREYVVASGGSLGVGILEADRITTVGRLGDVEVFDSALESEAGSADPEILGRVYRELVAFRRGPPGAKDARDVR